MILKFSEKIIQKEWKKLLLPFLSVFLTALVVIVSYLLTTSAKDFLELKNKEFLGGDASYESGNAFQLESLIDSSLVTKSSKQITFNAVLASGGKTVGASVKVVDQNFPLYGKYVLQNSAYSYLAPNEIYIDQNIAKALNVGVGGEIAFNEKEFTVKDIIVEDPQSLLGGFNFLGKVLFSTQALEYAKVDLEFFRKEYQEKIILAKELSREEVEAFRARARDSGARASFDATGSGRFQFGLTVVERFLVVTILIISVLSLVNIYASVNYLARRLRRSFAILIALGLRVKSAYKILFLVNIFIISLGAILGLIFGLGLTNLIASYVGSSYGLLLNISPSILEMILIFIALAVTSIFATIPVLSRMRSISPKELLTHNANKEAKNTRINILRDVLVGILPITFFAIYFLESLWYGALAIFIIVAIYGLVMLLYHYFINFLYFKRRKFSFAFKMVIAQKKFDGFFGLITFASLFVALLALYNLSIIRTSIESYLTEDLKRTLPSVYVLDIQGSQKDALVASFPDINLFPNVRARITSIDGVDIQAELDRENPSVDRELSREFNLTYRDYLMTSEKVVDGATTVGQPGEISVEAEFANRANIKLGSEMLFLIQGFKVSGIVTSIREVDSRSGLPFFYFVLSPEDIGKFPSTYFGYANIDQPTYDELATYLSVEIPNASIINTSDVTKIAETLISALLVIILIITIPPLVLSSLLIVTILYTVSKERKRDGARLMALGKTNAFIRNYYILESLSVALLASVVAYVFALLVSNFSILQYLEIPSLVYFDSVSFYAFLFILVMIIAVSIFTWRGGRNLREYLNYEENN